MAERPAARPALPELPALDALARDDRASFLAAANTLFETAPPLAEALFEEFRGGRVRSYEALIERAAEIADALPAAARLAVVNAHPRIGVDPKDANVSALSFIEQGLDREAETRDEAVRRTYAELAALNEAYERKFGFRFVEFVNGRSKPELVPVLRGRLANESRDAEMRAALDAMWAIARDRLKKLSKL